MAKPLLPLPFIASPPPARPLARWVCCIFFLALTGWFTAPQAAAQGSPRFTAEAEQTQVTVGEPFTFTISLDMSNQQLGTQPSMPAWGGLVVRRGPSTSQFNKIDAAGMHASVALKWELFAPRPGTYTIGASQVTLGGQTLQTQPVTITATQAPPTGGTAPGGAAGATESAPGISGGEPVISAHTDDPQLNQQLRGRLFLRTIVSNHQPYVGEPVVISYDLYNDRVQLGPRLSEEVGEVQGVLREELFHATQIANQRVNAGGHQYQVAPMYRMAVTPTKEGQLTINGYAMSGYLRVSGRRPPGQTGDPFMDQMGDMFNDPVFGGGVNVEIPSPPITLDVRPLPTAGQPQGFKGTVGEFTLSAQADRTQATTDDLITLKVTVAGRGAIELASPPEIADNPNFEVVGQSQGQPEKQTRQDGLSGSRAFEYVLRPRRAGRVEIPAVHYPVFNPYKEQYQSLQTQPIPVTLKPGKTALPAVGATAEDGKGNEPLRRDLRYIKTITNLQPLQPGRLMESPVFWLGQALALGVLVFTWRRNRRLGRLDLAQARRKKAWGAFARRLRELRQQAGLSPQDAAGRMDQATRAFIADRFNLSADGLTRFEIERLLLGNSMPQERVERLCDLVDRCAALRYAPATAGATGNADPAGNVNALNGWMTEIEALLKENLRA